MVEVSNFYYPILKNSSDILFCTLHIVCVMMFLFLAYKCDEGENDENAEVRNFSFSRGKVYAACRIALMFFILWSASIDLRSIVVSPNPIFEGIYRANNIFALLFLYLVMVKPLPPAKSKIKEWLEKMNLFGGKKVEATINS